MAKSMQEKRGRGLALPIFALSALLAAIPAFAGGNETNESFARARKALREIHADHRITLYCQAEYGHDGSVNLPGGFSAPSHRGRSLKIEWEHAVPAENFGRAFSEWREGAPSCVHRGEPFKGRRCAEKASREFRLMQADMHNLFPAIGSVNAARSNFRYAELPGEDSAFGSCPAKIGGKSFEPPDAAKGTVARAALYMEESYPKYRLSRQQRRLFEAWDAKFPPDAWECERERRIAAIQGNSNRFARGRCGAARD